MTGASAYLAEGVKRAVQDLYDTIMTRLKHCVAWEKIVLAA
jgi:hypothetical protein